MIAPILALPHGMHRGFPANDYHARVPGLVSRGALDLVKRSPAHYWAWVNGGIGCNETPALAFGKALHCATFEPSVFARLYAVEPDFGPCRANADLGVTTEQGRENKKRREAWRAEHSAAQLIDADDYAALVGMSVSLRAHPLASQALAEGESELTLRWRDAGTGLECKARDDFWVESLGISVDLKSTEDASPDGFRRSVAKYGYHLQASHYTDGHTAVGAPLGNFVFVAVEKSPPYAVGVYTLDEGAIAIGRAKARRLMTTMAECMRTGRWPGYAESIQEIELPPWAA